MAQLDASDFQLHSGLALARSQLTSIAWLRWRIYANGFRRKGGAGELIGRLLLLPFVAVLTLGPAAGAGFASWYLVQKAHPEQLPYVFWAAFVLSQLFNINLGEPGTTFDPTELIRFPLTLRSYILVRLGFGLLSPGNLVVSLMSVASFIGIAVAAPTIWPEALLATLAFAVTNVLFSRMVFAWVDRWLSTRRAREVFTGLIFAGSLLFQYINLNYNPGLRHGHRSTASAQHLHSAQKLSLFLHPVLRWLPPELTGSSLLAGLRGSATGSAVFALGTLLYGALFLAVYTLRMRTEYAGENLSDAANAVAPARPPVHGAHGMPVMVAAPVSAQAEGGLFPATLGPLLQKELLLLRRNVGLLYGVIAPTVMVFLFASRLSMRGGSHSLLLLAVAYALLGLAPMSYNSFGMEGEGAQFYFLAPVPLREVFLAKNTVQFLLALFDVCSIVAIISYMAGRPRSTDLVFVLLWSAMSLLFNASIGNLRTVSAPKKVRAGKAFNKTQSQLSAWIAIGIMAASAAVGAAVQLAAWYLHLPWLALTSIAILAGVAFFVYIKGLGGIERYAMDRRETLLEELGRKA